MATPCHMSMQTLLINLDWLPFVSASRRATPEAMTNTPGENLLFFKLVEARHTTPEVALRHGVSKKVVDGRQAGHP